MSKNVKDHLFCGGDRDKGKRQKTTSGLWLIKTQERKKVYLDYLVDRCSPRKSSIKAHLVLLSTQLHFLIYFFGKLLLNSMQTKVTHPTYREEAGLISIYDALSFPRFLYTYGKICSFNL